MANRNYRSGRDRYERERGYTRQAEQFEPDYAWREREEGRGTRQMGEGSWRDEEYGTTEASRPYTRERDFSRDRGYLRSSSESDSGVVSRMCGGRLTWRFLRSAGVSPLRVSILSGRPISSTGASRLRWTSCASALSGET